MKEITASFFKGIFPETIYEQTKEDTVFETLVFHDNEYLSGLLGAYFNRMGFTSPFNPDDFTIDHTMDDDLGIAIIRICIHNTKHSDVLKFYLVFRIVDQSAVDRVCYITEVDEDGSRLCSKISVDGGFEIIETDIYEDYEEEEVIVSDYLEF